MDDRTLMQRVFSGPTGRTRPTPVPHTSAPAESVSLPNFSQDTTTDTSQEGAKNLGNCTGFISAEEWGLMMYNSLQSFLKLSPEERDRHLKHQAYEMEKIDAARMLRHCTDKWYEAKINLRNAKDRARKAGVL